MKPAKTVAISSDAEIDRAMTTLVSAFEIDPVARWMYPTLDQYLLHTPRLFRALGASSFEAGGTYRTTDGAGVAIWLPPGVSGDSAPVEAVIAASLVGDMRRDVGALFEMTEQYRPTEPHWYLSLIGVEGPRQNKGRGAALLEHGLHQCDRDHQAAYLWSSNKQNVTLYQRQGLEVVTTIQVGSSPPIFPMLRRSR